MALADSLVYVLVFIGIWAPSQNSFATLPDHTTESACLCYGSSGCKL